MTRYRTRPYATVGNIARLDRKSKSVALLSACYCGCNARRRLRRSPRGRFRLVLEGSWCDDLELLSASMRCHLPDRRRRDVVGQGAEPRVFTDERAGELLDLPGAVGTVMPPAVQPLLVLAARTWIRAWRFHVVFRIFSGGIERRLGAVACDESDARGKGDEKAQGHRASHTSEESQDSNFPSRA